jgi:hypothetical protein
MPVDNIRIICEYDARSAAPSPEPEPETEPAFIAVSSTIRVLEDSGSCITTLRPRERRAHRARIILLRRATIVAPTLSVAQPFDARAELQPAEQRATKTLVGAYGYSSGPTIVGGIAPEASNITAAELAASSTTPTVPTEEQQRQRDIAAVRNNIMQFPAPILRNFNEFFVRGAIRFYNTMIEDDQSSVEPDNAEESVGVGSKATSTAAAPTKAQEQESGGDSDSSHITVGDSPEEGQHPEKRRSSVDASSPSTSKRARIDSSGDEDDEREQARVDSEVERLSKLVKPPSINVELPGPKANRLRLKCPGCELHTFNNMQGLHTHWRTSCKGMGFNKPRKPRKSARGKRMTTELDRLLVDAAGAWKEPPTEPHPNQLAERDAEWKRQRARAEQRKAKAAKGAAQKK